MAGEKRKSLHQGMLIGGLCLAGGALASVGAAQAQIRLLNVEQPQNAAPATGVVPDGLPQAQPEYVPANAAANSEIFEEAEWADGFDASFVDARPLDKTAPTVSHYSVSYIGQAVQRYENIVAQGGWEPVPYTSKPLRVGMRHSALVPLRKRLMAEGDLPVSVGISETFDSFVDKAVRRFQLRHGLVADGIVGKTTIEVMNIPAVERLNQLRINQVRAAELAPKLGDSYVLVNVPAARIEVVDHGMVRSRHTAVVGKIDRQTPLLDSEIFEVNFNPYWTVPTSIIRRDLIPKMQEDPSYLADNRIRIFDWHGKELQWQEIDWTTDQATQYRFTQDPGDGNSLGSVRINFHNKHQVYLHDTPEQSLFGSGYRFHSSGCVRVQNVRELVTWLLGSTTPEWDRQRVDEAIRGGAREDVKLKARVKLHLSYISAWAQADGSVHFRDDIYKMDGEGQNLVGAQKIQ